MYEPPLLKNTISGSSSQDFAMEEVEIENKVTFGDTLYNNKKWPQIYERCLKLKISKAVKAQLL